MWAQADATYTSLLLLSLVALIYQRNALGFIFFGLAISFKLQAIFLLPLLGVVYLRRRFSALYFLILPLTYLVIAAPALLAGMPPEAAFSTYGDQFVQNRNLTAGAPTIYQWIPNEHHDMFVSFGIAVALAAGLGLVSMAVLSKRNIDAQVLVLMSMALALAVPYVSPKMHERYFFPADVLAVVYAFYLPRRFYVPILVTMCSLLSYFPFLFPGQQTVPLPLVAIAMIVPVAIVLHDYTAALFGGPRTPAQVDSTDATPVRVPVAGPIGD